MQLVSKISNLCDPDPPTLQTDGQTDGRHAISIPRYALVHRAVKTPIHLTIIVSYTYSLYAYNVNFQMLIAELEIRQNDGLTERQRLKGRIKVGFYPDTLGLGENSNRWGSRLSGGTEVQGQVRESGGEPPEAESFFSQK